MGCLLGCFGLSSKRKRRKPPSRILPRDQQGFGSYEQLDNSGSTDIESNGEGIKEQAKKESLKGKIRKKVRFNLNVMAYEPISSQADSSLSLWVGDEDEITEEIGSKRGKALQEQPSSPSQEDPTATKEMASYPSNYRYRNCIDNYDDDDVEEEDFYDESDLDSDEDYDDAEEEEEAEGGGIEEVRRRTRGIHQDQQVSQHFSSLQVSPNSGILPEKKDQERSQYIHSVLNPVENLSQWKEIKAKGKQQQKKENTESMLLPVQGVAVDSSLSTWLASPPMKCQSKTGFDKSCARSWRSREESFGITDITNTST